MRSFVHILLGYLLALLVVGTSPVGTGRGVHQDQLLDALVPHVHFVDTQSVQKSAPATNDSSLYRSVAAFGAGAGAAAANSAGLAIVPVLPGRASALPAEAERTEVALFDDPLPRGRTEAPPDPPPTA